MNRRHALNTLDVGPDLWVCVLSTIAAAVVGEMHCGIGNGPPLHESDVHLIKRAGQLHTPARWNRLGWTCVHVGVSELLLT